MENINIYEDISNIDLGNKIHKLDEQNNLLLEHIRKLEGDVEKLCTELTNMKHVQKNLSRNISELFKTAKLEIQRKDRIISELRQEIDNMRLGKEGNSRSFKRQLSVNEINGHHKRIKNDFTEKENICMTEKESYNSRKSTPESVRDDKHVKHDSNTSKNDVKKDSRKISPERNHRINTRRDESSERENHINRHRSRSNERYRIGSISNRCRSRSRSRYVSNRNRNRSRRNRNTEQNINFHENINKNSRSTSKDNSSSRSRSIEYKHTNYKNKGRSQSHSGNRLPHISKSFGGSGTLDLTEDNLKRNVKEISYLTDDTLEDGEIATESDNTLIIEEDNIQGQYCTGDNKSTLFGNKSDMKSITIDEYRSRQKSVTVNVNETNVKPEIKNSDVIENNSVQNFTSNSRDFLNNEKSLIKNVKEGNTECKFKEESIKNVCLNECSGKEKSINPILNKSNGKEETISPVSLNESDGKGEPVNPISLNESNGSSKVPSNTISINISDSSFSSNSGNVSLNNNTSNNSLRARRRRCVVIGMKEKA